MDLSKMIIDFSLLYKQLVCSQNDWKQSKTIKTEFVASIVCFALTKQIPSMHPSTKPWLFEPLIQL